VVAIYKFEPPRLGSVERAQRGSLTYRAPVLLQKPLANAAHMILVLTPQSADLFALRELLLEQEQQTILISVNQLGISFFV
jgi:hypothetical protein